MNSTLLGILVFLFILYNILSYKLVREYFRCVFNHILLKPYNAIKHKHFKTLLRQQIGVISLEKIIYKYFSLISWIYIIILVILVVSVGIAVEDQYKTNHIIISKDEVKSTIISDQIPVQLQYIPETFRLKNTINTPVLVEVGCYSCPGTKEMLPVVRQVRDTYTQHLDYTYINIPFNELERQLTRITYCVGISHPEYYWQTHTQLIEYESFRNNPEELLAVLDINQVDVQTCLDSELDDNHVAKIDSFITEHQIGSVPLYFYTDSIVAGVVEADVFDRILPSR